MLAGFKWILPNRLAGSARPGLLDELDNDLTFLRESGIQIIVSLTRQPLPDSVGSGGFNVVHFPVPDMGIPTPRNCGELCRRLVDDLDASRPVLLHCRGGLGRTGTIAACCLVTAGEAASDALTAVRRINPNYVQTPAQAQFIAHYETWLRSES